MSNEYEGLTYQQMKALHPQLQPINLPPESEQKQRSNSRTGDACKFGIEWEKDDVVKERYKILSQLGYGAFSNVLECMDLETEQIVAIKVLRAADYQPRTCESEAELLAKLNSETCEEKNLFVQMKDAFWEVHRGQKHFFIVCEVLGKNLYAFLKRNSYRPFALNLVREIAYQIVKAVKFLHDRKLIHTDIKPENILFRSDDCFKYTEGDRELHRPKSPEIRFIDLGGVTAEWEDRTRKIGTRQYRAPEAVLWLPWSYPADIWAAGCVIAECAFGRMLFPSHDDLQQLAIMEQCLSGKLSAQMGIRAVDYFYLQANEARVPTGTRHKSSFNTKNGTPPDLFSTSQKRIRWPDLSADDDSTDYVEYYPSLEDLFPDIRLQDLLRRMLDLDPEKRMTVDEALQHPFFDECRVEEGTFMQA